MAISQSDKALAKKAIEKEQRKQSPTAKESAALKRVVKAREIENRQKAYQSVPLVEFCKMARRPASTIKQCAVTRELPMGGSSINLYEWVKDALDLISKIPRKNVAIDSSDSPELERCRKWKAKRERLAYHREKGNLVPRADVHDSLTIVGTVLRNFVESAQSKFGSELGEMFDEAFDSAKIIIRDRFGKPGQLKSGRANVAVSKSGQNEEHDNVDES